MAKIVGRTARVLLGNRNISPDTSGVTLTLSAEVPETTSFCDNYRTRINSSIRDIESSVDGFYNTGASTIEQYMASIMSSSALFGLYYQGLSTSHFGREFVGLPTSFELTAAIADAAMLTLAIAGSGTLYHMASLSGSSITPKCGTPVVSGAGASTIGSVDYGTGYNSANHYLTLRVFDLTGTTPELSASIQYSANDADWTTVYAIDAGTALSPAQITESSASLVELSSASRYRRAIIELGGTSPCATFMFASGSAVAG